MPIQALSASLYNKSNILYITYANITNFSLTKIVDYVPEAGIWRDQKLVICADAIYKFWLFQVHSRHPQLSQSVGCAYRIYNFQKTIVGEINTIWDCRYESGIQKKRKVSEFG
jgi:hypothetical protein